jgi:hypothetical protein
MLKAVRAGDVDALERTLTEQIRFRVAVRNVNDAAANIIASGLPPENGQEFLHSYQTRAYGRVFRSTKTQRLFKAARETSTASMEVLAAIDALERSYLAELGSVNQQILEALRKHEPDELRENQMRRWAPRVAEGGEPKPSKLEADFARRAELDRRFADQLKSVLPAELPENRDTANDG